MQLLVVNVMMSLIQPMWALQDIIAWGCPGETGDKLFVWCLKMLFEGKRLSWDVLMRLLVYKSVGLIWDTEKFTLRLLTFEEFASFELLLRRAEERWRSNYKYIASSIYQVKFNLKTLDRDILKIYSLSIFHPISAMKCLI